MANLNPKVIAKQEQFAREYLIDRNAKEAAIRAGYAVSGAAVRGHNLLKLPHVRAIIQQRMDERAVRADVKADDVLREIMKLAFGNIKTLFRDDGSLIPPHELPEEVAAFISGLKVKTLSSGEDNVVMQYEYKLADKKASLELLGRHMKLFTDKVEVTVDDKTSALIEARKRVESAAA
jgi:phage terminase small subunit